MLYKDARKQIKSGDLIAFSSDGWTGRAIRHFTGDKYSHVGIAAWVTVEGGGKRLLLIESLEGKGVSMRPLSGLAGGFFWITHSGTWGKDVINFAWDKVGVAHYGWGDIVRRIFGQDPRNDDVYICSELAGEMLLMQGLAIRPDEFGDPGKLVNAVLENGGVVHKIVSTDDLDARLQRVAQALQLETAQVPEPAET